MEPAFDSIPNTGTIFNGLNALHQEHLFVCKLSGGAAEMKRVVLLWLPVVICVAGFIGFAAALPYANSPLIFTIEFILWFIFGLGMGIFYVRALEEM